MSRRYQHLCFFLFLLTVSAVSAANYGKISGRIVDTGSGAPLAGVNVVIENSTMGSATDLEGYYVILQVPPGTYTLSADYIGYNAVRVENVSVRPDRIAYVNLEMKETVLETDAVVVIASRPVIEKDIAATSRNVSSDDIRAMPATTVSDVLRTQPGVVSSGGLHFRGGRSGEVIYYLDGVPMIDPLFSEINTTQVINQDAISDMQIISGTYSAEYGNAMSGIINITTKEGGGALQISADTKSSALGGETESVDHNHQVLRASLAGTMIPGLVDKTGYYLSLNYNDRDSYLPWGYRTDRGIFLKLTDRHFRNLKLSASFNYTDGIRKSYSHSFKYIPDQYWTEPRTHSNFVQLGITHTLSSSLFYNLMVYTNVYHYDSGDYDYNDLTPEYRRDENKEFYLQSYVSSYSENDQTTLGIKGDMLWQYNRFNEIKTGFEFRTHNIESFYISSPYYDDHVLDDYTVKPWEVSAFIQDKINFSSLILSAGLRFDLTAPNTDYWASPYDVNYGLDERFTSSDIHTQLSPRLAISYPISEKTVFHFGYGHYFQRPEYQFIYKSLSRNNSVAVYDVDKDGDTDYRDAMLMNLLTGNGRFGNPDLKPEKTIAYEFGVSHQFFDDYLFNVSVYSKNISSLVGVRTFFPGDSTATGEIFWETWTAHINEDFAYNNGLELQFSKKRGKRLFFDANYTWAVAEGASSGPLERVGSEEANRHTLKFFPLNFDQRHTVNANLTFKFLENDGPAVGTIHILENLNTSLLFRYGSGLPYTKGIRGATEPYEINNMRLPEYWTLDLKMDRRIPFGDVTVIPYLEIYNLTNRKNVVYVDSYTGKPDYIEGRTYEWAANPLNWDEPRIIYLGLQFNFR